MGMHVRMYVCVFVSPPGRHADLGGPLPVVGGLDVAQRHHAGEAGHDGHHGHDREGLY